MLALFLTLICSSPGVHSDARSLRSQLPSDLLNQVRRLESEYDLELILESADFVTKTKTGHILQGNGLTITALVKDLPIFLEEWQLLPSAFIKKVGVKRIHFCHNLNVAYSRGYLAGLMQTTSDTIYYSLDKEHQRETPSLNSQYLITLFHHELFHAIDHRLNKSHNNDPNWLALNDKEFKYRPTTYNIYTLKVSNFRPGFITQYAQNNMAEDKAETFSYMMTNLHEMECRAQDDPILQKKMEYIKLKLKDFSPDMDECFWMKIRHLNRDRLTLPGQEDAWALAHPTLPSLYNAELPSKRRLLQVRLPSLLSLRNRCR